MAEQTTVTDLINQFTGGQDAFHPPHLLTPDKYVKGINTKRRQGRAIGPRDGLTEKQLTFPDQKIKVNLSRTRTLKQLFENGKFQACMPCNISPESYLLIVIGGLFYRVNIRTWNVILLSETVRVDQYAIRINRSANAGYYIFYDYPDYPVIVDGDKVRRADPNNTYKGGLQPEFPISNLGVFNQSRSFVANLGLDFLGGDPRGSTATPTAPLTFTETLTPAAPYNGDAYSIDPINSDDQITGMTYLAAAGAAIGPLIVATENSLHYYRTDLPRSQWKDTQFGLSLAENAGFAGPRSFVNLNSDLYALSGDGTIYSLSTARADSERQGNVRVSREVENFIKFNDKALKQYTVLGYFNGSLWITVNPYRTVAYDREENPIVDVAFGGFSVLDISNTSTLPETSRPTWEGLWTGVHPMEFVSTGDRAFIIAKEGGKNTIFEVMPKQTYDIKKGKAVNIRSIIYPRAVNCQVSNLKKEKTISVALSELKGRVKVTIETKPDYYTAFKKFGEFNHFAPFENCETLCNPEGFAPHSFSKLVFGEQSTGECNKVSNTPLSNFYNLETRITISARDWALNEIEIKALGIPDSDRNNACHYEAEEIKQVCTPDWEDYETD